MWLWRLRVNREELTHAEPGGQPSHIFLPQPGDRGRSRADCSPKKPLFFVSFVSFVVDSFASAPSVRLSIIVSDARFLRSTPPRPTPRTAVSRRMARDNRAKRIVVFAIAACGPEGARGPHPGISAREALGGMRRARAH